MNEAETNALIERLVRRQEKSNEKILREIGRILGQIGELTPSEVYLIGQQLKYGESLQKIVKTIAETSRLNEIEIYKMLEHEAKTNLGFSEKYYKAKNVDFMPYEQNEPLKALVNQIATSTINQYRNISRTTGLTFLDSRKNKVTKTLQEAYSDIIDDAINNVATGKQTFQQSLTDQLKTIGKNGVQSIEYETGYHKRIDSALRMNLQDGLSYLFEAQQELMGSQFGADGMEVTTHSLPAPDHADIQGHIFTKDNFNKLQDFDFYGAFSDVNGKEYERTSEDKIRPIGELNCYHKAFQIVLGVDEPRYTQEELDKINSENERGFDFDGNHYTLYQGSQLQRRLELEIRQNREQNIGLKSALNNTKNDETKVKLQNEINKTNERINKLFTKYHDLSRVSGLKTKLERTRILTK